MTGSNSLHYSKVTRPRGTGNIYWPSSQKKEPVATITGDSFVKGDWNICGGEINATRGLFTNTYIPVCARHTTFYFPPSQTNQVPQCKAWNRKEKKYRFWDLQSLNRAQCQLMTLGWDSMLFHKTEYSSSIRSIRGKSKHICMPHTAFIAPNEHLWHLDSNTSWTVSARCYGTTVPLTQVKEIKGIMYVPCDPLLVFTTSRSCVGQFKPKLEYRDDRW